MRPNRAGHGTGRRRPIHAQRPCAGKPIGGPPRAFSKAEERAWTRCLRAWPWLDWCHRRWLTEVARNTAAIDLLRARARLSPDDERELAKREESERHHDRQAEQFRREVEGDAPSGKASTGGKFSSWKEESMAREVTDEEINWVRGIPAGRPAERPFTKKEIAAALELRERRLSYFP